jgi:CubicO group peptidase (beta-lactamase class C family)
MVYNEIYADPESHVGIHLRAAGYITIPPGFKHPTTHRGFLTTIKKGDGEHGQVFRYMSANTEVLAWIVEKVSSRSMNDLFLELIWSQIGAEENAYIIRDAAGISSWAGGFSATTRDMAKIGQMIVEKGKFAGEQLISPKIFESILQRDRRQHFLASKIEFLEPALVGWEYKNHFWFHANEHRSFLALGIHGQLIYIDPITKMVIAKNSSQPLAEGNPLEYDILAAAHALSKHLAKK